MKSERRVSISFRVPRGLLKILEEESKARDIPLSVLLAQVATKYANFDLLVERLNPMLLARETLLSFVNDVTEDQAEQKGKIAGSKLPNLLFKAYGIKPTLDSIMKYYFELLSRYAGWFKSRYFEEQRWIVLHHGLGVKWSCFLKGHIVATFKSVLKVDPKIDMDENSVTVYIK